MMRNTKERTPNIIPNILKVITPVGSLKRNTPLETPVFVMIGCVLKGLQVYQYGIMVFQSFSF